MKQASSLLLVLIGTAMGGVDSSGTEDQVTDWQAQWIAFPASEGRLDLEGAWMKNVRIDYQQTGLPIIRKTFAVNGGFKKAGVNVSGLGHYELFVNGRKAGDHFMDPPWSVYEKTVYYNTFDITDLLKEGENEFRIMLGKGFYNTHGDRRLHGVYGDNELMTILEARLEYKDGGTDMVITDSSWDVASGPITHSAIIGGSDYNATLAEPEPGIFVYDFGQNLSALPSIIVRGQKGQVIRLTPAEQRHGQTDRMNNGTGRVNQAGVGAGTRFEYTLNGEGPGGV